jgi:hypothetical protein
MPPAGKPSLSSARPSLRPARQCRQSPDRPAQGRCSRARFKVTALDASGEPLDGNAPYTVIDRGRG